MKRFALQRRTLALAAVVVPLLALFVYVALRSGPLAPVAVTVTTVEKQSVVPSLFGIGTVGARSTYKIGPTLAGRLGRLDVQVGDSVRAGQVLGAMDAVDLDDRIRAQEAAVRRAEATQQEVQSRLALAQTQAARYEQLADARATSEESAAAKRQELLAASAALDAARAEAARLRAERAALLTQRGNLRLVAPAHGLVSARLVDPGSTVVPGQTVVEVIDPASLWIHVRFDQGSARGLAAALPARVLLRSAAGQALAARVLRVEPVADAVTEETLAKVVFDAAPQPLPSVGELAEVTVALPALAAALTIPNAALRRVDAKMGVWQLLDGELKFVPVKLGAADLEGHVQVREGLQEGDRVVVYSEKTLNARSPFHVVERIGGAAP
jgi:RND family efflux transporter MFP subunit